MNFDRFASDAGRAVVEEARRVTRPAITEVRASRRRRAAVAVGLFGFLGTLAAIGGGILWLGAPGDSAPVGTEASTSTTVPGGESSTSTAALGGEDPQVFVPVTSSNDGTAVDLTLLDGSRITLTYPDGLDLVSNGLNAETVGMLDGDSRGVLVHYGPIPGLIAQLERSDGPGEHVRTYADGRGGGVEWWEFPEQKLAYLVFEFEPWTVYVWNRMPGRQHPRMSDAVQETWARTLRGSVTDDGFLVLGADPPLELLPAADGPGPDGPDIRIDGTDGGLGVFLNDCDRLIRLGDQSYGGPVYAFCDEESDTLIFVFADSSVQQQIDEHLQVTSVTLSAPEEPPVFVADGSDGGCGIGNMPDGWQNRATKLGPLWLWHVGPPGDVDDANRAVKTIAILEPGVAVTLTVPDTYRTRVGHLFDPSTWNQAGKYRIADVGRVVTFLPCESEPAQFVGGFVFRGEPCVELTVTVGRADPFTAAVPLGPDPCPESLSTRSPSSGPMFGESVPWVLLFDDGIDGVLAIDPNNRIGSRSVIEGQRAGDQPYRLELVNERLIVGWGEIYASDLDTRRSVLLGDATVYVPAAEAARVWLIDYPGGRIGLGTPLAWQVLVTGERLTEPMSVDIDDFPVIPAIGVRGGLAIETLQGVALWEAASGQVVAYLGTGTGFVSDASHEVNTRLAWCEDACTQLHITNLATGDELVVTHPDRSTPFDARSARFSNDQRFLAAPAGADVIIIDLETGSTRVGFTITNPDPADPFIEVTWAPFGPDLFASTLSYGEASMTIVRHNALLGETTTAELPFGGTVSFVVVDRSQGESFLEDQPQTPADCPPVSGFPSGRTGICGFHF